MRCPQCGARNPDEARWCGQCLTDLTPPPAQDAPATEVADPVEQPDLGLAADHDPAADDDVEPLESGGGRFRRHEGEIEWRCLACESWNPVGLVRCSVCSTGMAGPGQTAEPSQPASPAVVLTLSAVLPGAGHAALGRMATAWARGLTYLLWLLGGVMLLVSAVGSEESLLPGIILLLGAAALWAITMIDTQWLLARQSRQLLDARLFLWLVVGVIGLLMLTFMATFSRVGSNLG